MLFFSNFAPIYPMSNIYKLKDKKLKNSQNQELKNLTIWKEHGVGLARMTRLLLPN